MNEEEQLVERERKELRKLGNKFLNTMKEEVDSAVLLCDMSRLHDLVHAVDVVMGYQVLKTLRDKGFNKEITELCDKAGRKTNETRR